MYIHIHIYIYTHICIYIYIHIYTVLVFQPQQILIRVRNKQFHWRPKLVKQPIPRKTGFGDQHSWQKSPKKTWTTDGLLRPIGRGESFRKI